VAQGKSAMVGRAATFGAFATLLAGPTFLTMLISGVWHGAGYMFVVWGLMHGLYLSINHAWRLFGGRLLGRSAAVFSQRWPGFVLTFLAVVVAMVFFRSANGTAAGSILQGMFGLHGIGLPQSLFGPLASVAARSGGWLHVSSEISATDLVAASGWVLALLAVAWLLPNTLQVLERFAPGLSAPREAAFQAGWLRRALVWSPTLVWAGAVGLLVAIAAVRLGGQGEFLYWQF
jgi:hypothetical protein